MIGDKTLSLSPNDKGLSLLELWMDGSVVEIFLDRKEAMTLRSYELSSTDLRLVANGAVDAIHSLTVAGVAPISPDRLTT